MRKGKRSGIIRCLLYVALVTSVVTSVTLAKYSAGIDGVATGVVAAFVSNTSQDLEVPLSDLLSPGSTQSADFTITNYNSETDMDSDILLGYEIEIKTTGNLPLRFSLTGQKENADGTADEDDANSVLVDCTDFSSTLKAAGGRLPVVQLSGRKKHVYTLEITWPADLADDGYSDEIDRVAVTITTMQLNA